VNAVFHQACRRGVGRQNKKSVETRSYRQFAHAYKAWSFCKRIAHPRHRRGQCRRYSPRPHPPSIPERRIRRTCFAHDPCLSAPVTSSHPRLYLILGYHIIFDSFRQE